MNLIAGFRRYRQCRSEERDTNRRQMAGEDTTDGVLLWNRSKTNNTSGDSEIELVPKDV